MDKGKGIFKKESTNKCKVPVITIAVVLAAAILFLIAFQTAVCLKYPAATAAARSLDRGGVSPEDLDAVIGAITGLITVEDRCSLKFYDSITAFTNIEPDAYGNAAYAYFDPDKSVKSAFSAFKYVKCVESIEKLADLFEGDEMDFKGISAEKWRASMYSVKTVAERVKDKGYSEWSARIASLGILLTDDKFRDTLSVKEIYRTLDYVKFVTAEIKDLTLIDLVFGKGFAERTETGNMLILSALRRLSYEKYLELFANLPDIARFFSEVIKFIFENVSGETSYKTGFARALKEWKFAVSGKDGADEGVYALAVGTLLALPGEKWSDDERAAAVAAVEALMN